MKVASIVPMNDVERTFDGSYAMLLSHLKDYYPQRKRGDNCYRIMDNSLIELGGAVDMLQLVTAAMCCDANEIILPDVFQDCDKTLKSVDKALEWIYKHGFDRRFRLMAVCQGETIDEFERCFERLERLKEVHCIGIPKVAETLHSTAGRPYFEYLWYGCPKDIHLLGCWTSLREIKYYQRPEMIRSIDTCIPALNAIYGMDVWQQRTKERTINLTHDKLNEVYYDYNINQLKQEGWL